MTSTGWLAGWLAGWVHTLGHLRVSCHANMQPASYGAHGVRRQVALRLTELKRPGSRGTAGAGPIVTAVVDRPHTKEATSTPPVQCLP